MELSQVFLLIFFIGSVCSLCLRILSRHAAFYRHIHSTFAQRRPNQAGNPVPRLSKDSDLIQAEYDIVIIGSGYGGGVAASRMARAGKRVCLLERGTERWPKTYPHNLKAALGDFKIEERRSKKHSSVGESSALYHLSKGEGQDVFSGCGLGGTSLINAGVFLRPDGRIFECQEWPVEIREHSQNLSQYYERGERMFQPEPYPESLPKPHKLSVFEHQAQNLGLRSCFYRPPLTVNFADSINKAGVKVYQSTGSGNECTGINDGSKSSVLITYIADAWNWGAEIFCGVNVSHVSRRDKNGGYIIYYNRVGGQRANKRLMWVRAKELVFLGAGSLGTTEILLRSRSRGLSTSPLLGQRLSGNGDLLAFAYNCDLRVNSIGQETSSLPLPSRCGPTILGCIDLRGKMEAPNVRDGHMIQDGAVPEALGPVLQAMIEPRTQMKWDFTKEAAIKTIAKMKSWMFGPYFPNGSVSRTAVYLVMSHDDNEGTMKIENQTTTLRWSGSGSKQRTRRIQDVLRQAAAGIGGTFVAMPHITVHPLGGACMSGGNSGFGGVVNHKGQLYRGTGQEVYDGIVCVDASIVPMSLGVNPCATITALAERCCDMIIRDHGLRVDERPNEPLDMSGKPYKSFPRSSNLKAQSDHSTIKESTHGLQFDEVLEGPMCAREDDCNSESAAEMAETASSSAKLSITVSMHRYNPISYKGSVIGTFSHGAISSDPLLITEGSVEFFTVDLDVSDAVRLVYDLKLLNTDGEVYLFHGYKTIDSSISFSMLRAWRATTTLHAAISLVDGTLVSKGLLRLSHRGFLLELMSLRCDQDVSLLQSFCTKAQFLGFFARNVLSYMLSPLRPLQYNEVPETHFSDLKKPIPVETWIQSEDGVQISIKRWEPPVGMMSKAIPIVLIPGASVDDQIFSLPTIHTNAIDYLTSQGYRCYVPVLRFGIGDEAKMGWTVFDARLDVKAVVQYVRKEENNKQLYAIVHCLGSIATATALLHGDVDADWFIGMACSQVFTDLVYSQDNQFKAGHQSFIKAYRALAGEWFSCRVSPMASRFQSCLDQLLRFYPVGHRKELCNSVVCHRCNVPFGRCWNHANLNHATHACLGELFDGIHMNFLTHLSRMGATPSHHVRANLPDFADLMTQDNLRRLAGLQICFLSGGDNAVWQPLATKKSLDMFRHVFPNGRYERVLVEGYGHLDCWMGKDAYKDVYPRIEHHIRSCAWSASKHTGNVFEGKTVDDDYVNILQPEKAY